RPLTLKQLADQEAMSVRTFTRRFREEVGITPLRWLTQQRIEHARHLLEETDLPVERVAADAGFGTAASLRQHFHASLGVSPRAYRRTFRVGALDEGSMDVTGPLAGADPVTAADTMAEARSS
ncbi:helix-turn-helix domain-containing protein, partial [Streptomyces sp. PU-14G]|uniref:helix-turn-helix domain-containing protein n=1 Tax=Streptomyces sp. PU-14G TaxID=2800808 RepID=UPI0034DF268F